MLPRISGMQWAALAGVLSACATLGRPKETENGRDFIAEFIPRPEWARRRDELLQGDVTYLQQQPAVSCSEAARLKDSLVVDPDDPSVRFSGREETVSSACYYSYILDQYTVENSQRAHLLRFAGGSIGHVWGQIDTAVVYSHKLETQYQKERCAEDRSCQEERWVPREEKKDIVFNVYGIARLDVLGGEPALFQSIDSSLNVFLEGVPAEIQIKWGEEVKWGEEGGGQMYCLRKSGKWECATSYDTRYKGKLDDILRGGLNAYYASVALTGLLD